jgi:subtilisin family serine protease
MSGTSMAAPIVAGVAAMFMSLNPSYSYRDIIKVIMDSSESRSNLKDKVISGKAIDANSVIRFISAPKNLRVRQ